MPLETPSTNDPDEEALYVRALDVSTAPGAPPDVQTRAAYFLTTYLTSGRASEEFVLRVWQRTSPGFWRLVGPPGSFDALYRRVLDISLNREDVLLGETERYLKELEKLLPKEPPSSS